MESKLMFLVVCLISCMVPCIQVNGQLPTPSNLTYTITNTECRKSKLCLDSPKGCDPSGSSQCFFTSAQIKTSRLIVELSGNSPGYIALTAGSSQGSSFIIFVCGNNNGRFFFRTVTLNSNALETKNVPFVNSTQGQAQSGLIQCVFTLSADAKTISNLTGTIINSYITKLNIYLGILKGPTNGTQMGTPTSVFESPVLVDLLNVSSTNVVSSTSNGITLKSLLVTPVIAVICLSFLLYVI